MNDIDWNAALLATVMHGKWLNNKPAKSIDKWSLDSRQDNRDSIFFAISGERFDGHQFVNSAIENGAAAVVISDSKKSLFLNLTIPVLLVDDPLSAYQRLASYHRLHINPNLKVFGVTGSSGKTSSKEMLRAALVELKGEDSVLATVGNTNNHVGVPQNLLKLTPQHQYAVIEMGTNHHGEIAVLANMVQPDAALITCIGASHLEYFKEIAEVAREKSSIFKFMDQKGIGVIPEISEGQTFLDHALEGKNKYTFGDSHTADMNVEYLGSHLRGSCFILHSRKSGQSVKIEWSLSGKHQAMNAAAVAMILESSGFELSQIGQALSHTQLPGMRSRITEKNGTYWINDAYNANPESMVAAVNWLAEFVDQQQTLLVLGDMRELGKMSVKLHEEVLELVQKKLPEVTLVLVGHEMITAAHNCQLKNQVFTFADSSSAREQVQLLSQQKKIIFLKASRGTALELIE